jgi:chromosome segregation ATPase
MKKRQVQIDEEVKSAKDQMDSATTLQLQLKESQTKCAGLESKIEQLLAAQRQQEQQQSSQQNNSSKIVNDFVRRLPHQEEVEDNSEKFPLQNSLRNMNSLHRQLVETSTIIEENNELKKMLQVKDERLSELVQELNQYRTSAAATDATTAPITTHDEHNASEQAELQDLKRALQERDDKIDDLKEDLSKAQSKLAKTTDKLVGVEKGKEQEVKSLRSRIEVLEKQILDSEERLESFKHFNAKLMEDVASARESSRLLQGDLDESTAHRGQLEKEKAHTEKECERLFIELQSERRRVYDDARQSATSRSGRYTYNDAAESSSEDEVEEQDDIDRYHEDEDDDDDDDNDDFDCDDDDQPYDELSSKKRNWNCDKSNEDDGDDDEEEDDEDEEEGGEQKRQRTVEVINIGDTSDEDEDE